MDVVSIIIDRVDSTNVFNLIEGGLPTNNTHLQRPIDEDLIREFLSELEKYYRISNSINEGQRSLFSLDILSELRKIGEMFFRQFFPEEIQERLCELREGYLFFHTAHPLRHIPMELIHDGNSFLLDKFFIGKNSAGSWKHTEFKEMDRLRVLIIADPTEDLEWARREGETLFESLNAELSADRLDIEFQHGHRITKLNLLNSIKNKDIIHYSGHLHYDDNPSNSGWLLSDNKVLRAREIEKAGISPHLVFSNSCLSSPLQHNENNQNKPNSMNNEIRMADLAKSFLKAGIGNYIGTNWEIKDSKLTHDFAMYFYRAIFQDCSVGEALFEARQHFRQIAPKNDLTWANYTLHGNPQTKIYRTAQRRTIDASRSQLNSKRIIEDYPTPIAKHYKIFLTSLEDKSTTPEERLNNLIQTFKFTLLMVGAIIFGNFRHLNFKGDLPRSDSPSTIREWVESIYHCIRNIQSLKIELAIPGLLECLYLHREPLYKLLDWSDKFDSNELREEDYEIHIVTFQYTFDNLIHDFSALSRHQVLYVHNNDREATLLRGIKSQTINILPPEFEEESLKNILERNSGKTCFYNNKKKVLFPIESFASYDPEEDYIHFPAFTNISKKENVNLN